jgi:hypothetical protein
MGRMSLNDCVHRIILVVAVLVSVLGFEVSGFQCQRSKVLISMPASSRSTWHRLSAHSSHTQSVFHTQLYGHTRSTTSTRLMATPIEVKMPALSSTMKEGKIVSWRYCFTWLLLLCFE